MKKSLLEQLEDAVNDLRRRAEEAGTAAQANRQKRARALVTYDAATIDGDKEAQAEAEAEIKALDSDHELLERQHETLSRAVHSGEGKPREIARAIKKAREAELAVTKKEAEAQAQEIARLAALYLAAVAKLGQIHQAGGLQQASFSQAAPYLPETERQIFAALPHVNHQGRQGCPYLIDPQNIEQSFRDGFNTRQ